MKMLKKIKGINVYMCVCVFVYIAYAALRPSLHTRAYCRKYCNACTSGDDDVENEDTVCDDNKSKIDNHSISSSNNNNIVVTVIIIIIVMIMIMQHH